MFKNGLKNYDEYYIFGGECHICGGECYLFQWWRLHFLVVNVTFLVVNVTFLVVNVTFFSGGDYIFDCRIVLQSHGQEVEIYIAVKM